jgi:hypothetical protein
MQWLLPYRCVVRLSRHRHGVPSGLWRKQMRAFPGVLDPSLQPSMECFRQVVVPVAILEDRSNLFVLRPKGDAMENVWRAHSRRVSDMKFCRRVPSRCVPPWPLSSEHIT